MACNLDIASLLPGSITVGCLRHGAPAYAGLFYLAFRANPQTALSVFPKSLNSCPASEHGAGYLFGLRELKLRETCPRDRD